MRDVCVCVLCFKPISSWMAKPLSWVQELLIQKRERGKEEKREKREREVYLP